MEVTAGTGKRGIRLRGVSKAYESGVAGRFTALRDVDVDIGRDRITVLKGPSGSGKTTMLSLIGGLSRPTSGRIWINDTEITGLPEHFLAEIRRRRFGFVFQDVNLITGATVLENVMLPAYPTPASNRTIRRRGRDLLNQLEIGPKAMVRAGCLSGGEQQRAAIARALINDPDYMIADEPTAHLDTQLTRRFMEIVARLRDQGKTVLLGSHDPRVFESDTVDSVIELSDGRIVEET